MPVQTLSQDGDPAWAAPAAEGPLGPRTTQLGVRWRHGAGQPLLQASRRKIPADDDRGMCE